MRNAVTMRFDREVLKAARRKAGRDNRTLARYIESLVRRDLEAGPVDPKLEIIAPADIRDSVAVAFDGETKDERQRREEVFLAVIGAGGR